jgi:hypothetical protein
VGSTPSTRSCAEPGGLFRLGSPKVIDRLSAIRIYSCSSERISSFRSRHLAPPPGGGNTCSRPRSSSRSA